MLESNDYVLDSDNATDARILSYRPDQDQGVFPSAQCREGKGDEGCMGASYVRIP